MMSRIDPKLWLLLAALAVLAVIVVNRERRPKHVIDVVVTLGEVQAVHAEVKVGDAEVHGVRRFSAEETLTTGPDGRARMRLDDGTTLIVDRETRLRPGAAGVTLEAGRVFVKGGKTAKLQVTVVGAAFTVTESALAVAVRDGGATVYCADGEAVVALGDLRERLRGGETATIAGGKVTVAPEKAFNDWTGGMAMPWSATGRPRPAIGELWAVTGAPGDGGSPLTVRKHRVDVRLEGEVAMTHVETTYFNAGSVAVDGDFRVSVPDGAIVSRFAVERDGSTRDGTLLLADSTHGGRTAKLEWAGPEWARGSVPDIASGAIVTVIVDTVEWLDFAADRVAYRYPMVSSEQPPLIGEQVLRVDVSRLHPTAVAIGAGARLTNGVVEQRGSDVRPEADFVVELTVPERAPDGVRATVANAGPDDDTGDRYYLVRAPVPATAGTAGVTLALVVDTSQSTDPTALEAARALVESIVEGLGSTDRVAIVAADQQTRFVGDPGLLPVTEERRHALGAQLAELRPAGATDLGAALEFAADALPKESADAMVVYIGDGWPTVGELDFEALRARLARREGGVPRLAAVALGAEANGFGLGGLVRGAGPVLSLTDRSSAPEVAVALLTSAILPVVTGVELDLGPTVDRVFPRGQQTLAARGTAMVVGRLRGDRPTQVTLRYRRGAELVEERRPVTEIPAVKHGDIRRRWASARVDDILRRGESRDLAADIAVRAKLLSPWTGFYLDPQSQRVGPSRPLAERVFDPDSIARLRLEAASDESWESRGALLEPRPPPHFVDDGFETLVSASARRTLERIMPGVRRCRAARVAARPEVEGPLVVRAEISGSGRVLDVAVRSRHRLEEDPPLNRCVASLIKSQHFFDSDTKTTLIVEHELQLPRATGVRARRCSETSRMPLALRLPVWRERLTQTPSAEVFDAALSSCELSRWADRKTLLDLMLTRVPDVSARLELSGELERAGREDASAYVRQVVIRGARTPEELAEIRRLTIQNEPEPGKAFAKQYAAAKTEPARLSVVERFLVLSPHDATLRRARFRLLEALGEKDALVQAVEEVRRDPFADAALLADGAAALGRLGRTGERLRGFGELVERAPRDPFGRALAGDRLRDVGLFDEATTAYEVLGAMLPDDPSAALRLGLAHAGAGRLDLATRVLHRVATTGGRMADMRLGELSSVILAVLLAEAKDAAKGDDVAQLARRLGEVPLPDVAGVVLVRTPALAEPVEVRVARRRGKADPLAAQPDLIAPSLGLFADRIERGDDEVRVRLKRPEQIGPTPPVKVLLDRIELDAERRFLRRVARVVEVPADGKDVTVSFDAEGAP